jgi:hypothetical protein
MTAAARPADCPIPCTLVHNKMSDPYVNFINTAPMGTTSSNNAKRVVRDQSWDAVAANRPLPSVPKCQIRIEFNFCDGPYASQSITAWLPGYTVTYADYDWSLNGTGWMDLYEGGLTCPSLTTNSAFWARAILTLSTGQISICTISVGPRACSNDREPF